MRKIFYTYWLWYVLTLLVLISSIEMNIMMARIFAMNMFLSYSFIAIAPLFNLIYCKKSHYSDQRYLNACLYSCIIRTVVWFFAFFGINDYKLILALNAFGLLVFVLIERKLKQISGEYFNF